MLRRDNGLRIIPPDPDRHAGSLLYKTRIMKKLKAPKLRYIRSLAEIARAGGEKPLDGTTIEAILVRRFDIHLPDVEHLVVNDVEQRRQKTSSLFGNETSSRYGYA